MMHWSADSGEYDPGQPKPEAVLPSDALMEYIRGQFEDAYTKEHDEDLRGVYANHGSFYQQVPLPLKPSDEMLPKNTTRIVLKQPHPHDQPGFFIEVFGVYTRGTDGHMVADTSGLFADQYVVREHVNGAEGPAWLVDETGVHPMELGEVDFDAVAGIIGMTEEDVFKPYERADEMLEKLSRYNIVAVDE